MLGADLLLLALSLGPLAVLLHRFDDPVHDGFGNINAPEHIAQAVRDVLLAHIRFRASRATVINVGFCSRVSTRITGREVLSCVPPRSARTGIAGCGTPYGLRLPVQWRSNQRAMVPHRRLPLGGFFLQRALLVPRMALAVPRVGDRWRLRVFNLWIPSP